MATKSRSWSVKFPGFNKPIYFGFKDPVEIQAVKERAREYIQEIRLPRNTEISPILDECQASDPQ